MRRLVTDTLIIAERNLIRLPRKPELLLAFTVQPIMFVLLFRYVFGGAINTGGVAYVDFLIPGIIVQNIAFGGFVTALGLNEDVHKGLIDRFRSLPMARPAVLAGRTLADIVTNFISVCVLVVTGLIIGFSFTTSVVHVIAGFALLLLVGYAFSWVFALVGLLASTPESANSVGFIAIFPLTFISSAFVPDGQHGGAAARLRQRQPVHDLRQRHALAVDRDAGPQLRLGLGGVGGGDPGGVRAAGGGSVPPRRGQLSAPPQPRRTAGTTRQFCSPRATARHASQCGHGGFHGYPVTSLPHSAVSGSSVVTRWQSSSKPSLLTPGTLRHAGWTLGARVGAAGCVGIGFTLPRADG